MAQDITITKTYADSAALTEAKLDATKNSIETHLENILNGAQSFDAARFDEVAAPSTPASGKVVLYAKTDGLLYSKDDAGTETLVSGGAGGGSIGGSTGATDNRLLRADGTGGATVQNSAITVSDTGAMTGVSIDADGSGNVITNIGSSEIKAEIITGLTADASPDGAADYVMTYDNSATALKKVLLNNLPGSGATVVTANKVYKSGSLYTSTSGTMTDVDATNAAITITATGSGKALVIFSFIANKATAGSGYYRITDGTNHSDEVQNEFATITGNGITLMWEFTTSAGSTTYKLQYRTSDANAVQVRNERAISMVVQEIA
jgi:hypothetical protein